MISDRELATAVLVIGAAAALAVAWSVHEVFAMGRAKRKPKRCPHCRRVL